MPTQICGGLLYLFFIKAIGTSECIYLWRKGEEIQHYLNKQVLSVGKIVFSDSFLILN
jgi:hypothetical protein